MTEPSAIEKWMLGLLIAAVFIRQDEPGAALRVVTNLLMEIRQKEAEKL